MKIVLATKSVPFPLTNGSAIRNFQMIRWLSLRHEVTLVTFVRSDEELAGIVKLKGFCRDVVTIDERRTFWRKARDAVRCIATQTPYTVCAHRSARFRAALTAATADADLLQLQELYLTASLPTVDIPVVLDAHNVEATILERLAAVEYRPIRKRVYHWQARAMDTYERAQVPSFAGVIALSRAELLRFESLHNRVTLSQNGVEPRALLPDRAPHTPSMLFVGTLDYPPNRDAVEHFIADILPQIAQRLPKVELRIIGAIPRWAKRFANATGVRFLGRVADLTEEFSRAAVMVVPLRAGGGTRLKILDAFTAGVPVVSTTIGAEGLGVIDGEQLLLRDHPESFAAAVCTVLEAPTLQRTLARNAFEWSQRTLRWDSTVASLEPFYRELLTQERIRRIA